MALTVDRAEPREIDLAARLGPTLSDGTALRDLIDFENRTVSMRVLRDPEIHRLELKRIFARSWVGIGHVGEIPSPGDFVTRYIGEDQVIMTRAKDGSVQVLLNVCAHRGMQVCWADEGNRSTFKCPYHGWVFDSKGALVGAAVEKEMYGNWDKSQFHLRRPKVEVLQGRVYANFDPDAPTLDEWLGGAKWYLDFTYGEEDKEMEVLLPPRRFLVHVNWKVSADNISGDIYHGMTLHRSLFEMGLIPADERLPLVHTMKACVPEGHGMVVFPGFMLPEGDENPEVTYDLDGRLIGAMLFPATFGLGGSQNMRIPGPDGKKYTIMNTGGLVPRGPNAFELWAGALIERDAPDELRAAMRASGLVDLGGIDDFAGWPMVQRAAQGVIAEEQTLKYNAVAEANTPEGYPGPGSVYKGLGGDNNQWNFWLRWFELMTTDEA
ncbi:MAG TPA: Rieske 2Fe-2S domain-containing protein [Acidimicrobiales bacterium]